MYIISARFAPGFANGGEGAAAVLGIGSHGEDRKDGPSEFPKKIRNAWKTRRMVFPGGGPTMVDWIENFLPDR
jgi:hypothetical protein